VCPEWKAQQKGLWAEVRKKTRKWESRWKALDLLDFLSAMDVGKLVPSRGRRGSEVSEWERREREDERGAEVEELGAAGELGAVEELPLFLSMASAEDDEEE